MKSLLIIVEGAADCAQEALEGFTPLQLARNVNASAMVARGACGMIDWSDSGTTLRLEQALALILGVDPLEARALRRGPIEAAGTAVDPATWTYAYRGNFVTVDQHEIRESRVSHLSWDETQWLTDVMCDTLREKPIHMAVVAPARVVVLFDQLQGDVEDGEFPDVGQVIDALDEAEAARKKSDRWTFMQKSAHVLARQTINDVRLDLGENPANQIWLWGGGPPAVISRPFLGAPLKAAMVSNSAMALGLARLCGMKHCDLGDLWSDNAQPELVATAALEQLVHDHELTVMYVEAPLEQGHFGLPVEKVKGLDRLDTLVLSRVAELQRKTPELKVMLAALSEEGAGLKQTPVCCLGGKTKRDNVERWDEISCEQGSMGRLPARRLLTRILGDE